MGDMINETMKRTRRYWYIDGISEIASGLFIMLLGGFFAVVPSIPSLAARTWVLALGQPLLVLVGFWLGARAVNYVKERVTYPRTGYVAFRKQNRKRRWSRIVLVAVISASFGLLASFLFNIISDRWIPLVAAGFMSLFVLYIAYALGLIRFYALAVYFLVSGLLVAWLMPPEPYDMAALMSLCGLGVLVSGALALRYYLAHTQKADEDPL